MVADGGMDTFVQGTVVKGYLCPRRQMSKETVVQGDFGPRRLLSKEAFTSDKLAHIIFFILYWMLLY